MTKANLYKRRNKNRQSKLDGDDGSPSSSTETPLEQADLPPDHPVQSEPSFIQTITDRMNKKSSIDNDVQLIRANTVDTPVDVKMDPMDSTPEEVPSVKPVVKTYAKQRSKLDDFLYIDSIQGSDLDDILDDTQKNTRSKSKKGEVRSPPRKRRKVDKSDERVDDRTTRSLRNSSKQKSKVEPTRKSNRIKSPEPEKSRTNKAKESIENDKSNSKYSRKRKLGDNVPLREKGQNSRASNKRSLSDTKIEDRTIAKPKKTTSKLKITNQPTMVTRAMRRRIEVSLSPSEVKAVVGSFSFESDERKSIDKSRKANTKASPKVGKVRGKLARAKNPPSKKRRR